MTSPEKPTELIYLPEPSWLPAIAAAGIAGVLIGLYSWFPYAIVGAIVAIVAIVAWVKRAGGELAAMPRSQKTDTAPVPLSAATPRD